MGDSNFIKVKSADHLKKLIEEDEQTEFFIQLNFGFRSSKVITINDNGEDFDIINEIDDTEQTLMAEELFDKSLTNIGEAITKGAFWCYNY